MHSFSRDRPLAYHRARPDSRFWTNHWATEDLAQLLAVAETSPLTRFLERYVRPGRRVLEAGCGLGQYVRYFAARGVEIVGVDFSSEAIARHRSAFPDSDVRVADLESLPFPDATFDVYVSLGVIEHAEAGATAILEEARRVLRADGDLVLSTPYLNLSRRFFRPVIEREQRAARAAGADFYQYAFSSATLERILRDAGFDVGDRFRYDPGRGVRDVRALFRRPTSRQAEPSPAAPRPPHGRLVRRIIYSSPFLATFAHMQIVRARPRAR